MDSSWWVGIHPHWICGSGSVMLLWISTRVEVTAGNRTHSRESVGGVWRNFAAKGGRPWFWW